MPNSTNRAGSDLRSVVYSRAHKPVYYKLVICLVRSKRATRLDPLKENEKIKQIKNYLRSRNQNQKLKNYKLA